MDPEHSRDSQLRIMTYDRKHQVRQDITPTDMQMFFFVMNVIRHVKYISAMPEVRRVGMGAGKKR